MTMVSLPHPIMDYPHRSPLKVAEVLQDMIRDKVVCDVGCACGDLMFEFSKYCKRVVGIEKDPVRAGITRKRGLELVDHLPDADIYYLWIGLDSWDFLELFRDKKGKLILAEEDISPELGGYQIVFPIDDVSKIPNNDRTVWHLQVLEL